MRHVPQITFVAAALAASSTAFAVNTVGFKQGGFATGCAYPTIEAALAAADSLGYTQATIFAQPTSYTVASTVHIINGAVHTIRQGNATCNAHSAAGTVTINGPALADRVFVVDPGGQLWLKNVDVSTGSTTGSGGLIYVNNGELHAENVDFGTGDALDGGCVAANESAMYFQDVNFNDCHAFYNGGAVYTAGTPLGLYWFGGSVGEYADSDASEGGAIFAYNIDYLVLSGLVVEGHLIDKTGRGGGLYAEQVGAGLIEDSTFHDCTGDFGAGLYFNDSGAWIEDSNIRDNNAGVDGGGIYAEGATNLQISGSSIDTNTALNDGGGIYFGADDAASLLVNDGTGIVLNTTIRDGGASAWAPPPSPRSTSSSTTRRSCRTTSPSVTPTTRRSAAAAV